MMDQDLSDSLFSWLRVSEYTPSQIVEKLRVLRKENGVLRDRISHLEQAMDDIREATLRRGPAGGWERVCEAVDSCYEQTPKGDKDEKPKAAE